MTEGSQASCLCVDGPGPGLLGSRPQPLATGARGHRLDSVCVLKGFLQNTYFPHSTSVYSGEFFLSRDKELRGYGT